MHACMHACMVHASTYIHICGKQESLSMKKRKMHDAPLTHILYHDGQGEMQGSPHKLSLSLSLFLSLLHSHRPLNVLHTHTHTHTHTGERERERERERDYLANTAPPQNDVFCLTRSNVNSLDSTLHKRLALADCFMQSGPFV
jgi:hypothetical protein